HAERSALDQLMIFFNRHVHGKKATECDDGPPAQKQSSDKEHHASERKASLMRQCRSRQPFCDINPRRHTHHDYQPHDAQGTAMLLRPGEAARAARHRQQQFRDQINQSEQKGDYIALSSLLSQRARRLSKFTMRRLDANLKQKTFTMKNKYQLK